MINPHDEHPHLQPRFHSIPFGSNLLGDRAESRLQHRATAIEEIANGTLTEALAGDLPDVAIFRRALPLLRMERRARPEVL
jgi:hypothetical protein